MTHKSLHIAGKIVLWLAIVAAAAAFIAAMRLPRIPDDLDKIALNRPTRLFDDQGRLVKTLSNRQPVSLEHISEQFLHAVLALEDQNFARIMESANADSCVRFFKPAFRSGGTGRLYYYSTVVQEFIFYL
ncbi:MAG: hypothetical protein U5R06_14420 [candidate division KSB1 bacterium]|nr:hypothetical protein [candidate division KSB1 bacterium]